MLPTSLPAWTALAHSARHGVPHLRELLARPEQRPAPVSAPGTGISLDFSRQAIDDAVLDLLLQLAGQARVAAQRDAMFSGEPINRTEHRAVLHVALRGAPGATGPQAPWGTDIQEQVHTELDRVCAFADAVRNGSLRGSTGLPFSDVIHIGIGGSDLGPRMASTALAHLCHPAVAEPALRVHHLSNPDPWGVQRLLIGLDPARTLVVVASKTFTTQETMANACAVRRWMALGGVPEAQQGAHLVAITAAPQRSTAAGYPASQTFTFWDWVGGRYSVWSALGLPLALSVGSEAFRGFHAGGRAMDRHFREAPLAQNLPVLMALLGIWNRNFLECPALLLSAYPSRLSQFVPFIQQMDMESNGKRMLQNGQPCPVATGPVVWGGLGIDGQHAYFQLLHQGVHRVPVEFVGVVHNDATCPSAEAHHRLVNLNLRAQAEALARGRTESETRAALQAEGLDPAEIEALATQRSYPGNVPSSTVWLDNLTPATLGALVALYEHKVFVQAAVWGINAYDQWGVELGKTMAKAMDNG
jgi:glucose-6-phosphate isomerase